MRGLNVSERHKISKRRCGVFSTAKIHRSKNDELADEVKFLQATGAGGAGGGRPGGGLELETIPPSVKERLLRLEHENKKLRAAGTSQNADLLQTMIDDLKERETQLQASGTSFHLFSVYYNSDFSQVLHIRKFCHLIYHLVNCVLLYFLFVIEAFSIDLNRIRRDFVFPRCRPHRGERDSYFARTRQSP